MLTKNVIVFAARDCSRLALFGGFVKLASPSMIAMRLMLQTMKARPLSTPTCDSLRISRLACPKMQYLIAAKGRCLKC
jgi:hypothetical protein